MKRSKRKSVVRKPKTRKVGPRRQHVLIKDRLLLRVLRAFLSFLLPGEKVWPFELATFGRRLERILKTLGAVGAFTPGGLRAGGATHYWMVFRNQGLVSLRGRWLATRSLEHYLQECASFLERDEAQQKD